jgi:hypothetical protein
MGIHSYPTDLTSEAIPLLMVPKAWALKGVNTRIIRVPVTSKESGPGVN